MAEEYLDFSQALDALNITETELWELIHSGTLKAYRAGGVIKFKKSDIIAYQKSRGTEPTIVVSRKMLDSMDEPSEDEEGMDTEVGLRASRRPADDDLATSEITAREKAVDESEDTEPVDAKGARRASARASATTSRAPAATVRSKRISAVLETEKKGNPIINAVMAVCCLILIYGGLVQLATLRNSSWTADGMTMIQKPAWVSEGLLQWGTSFGGGDKTKVADLVKSYKIVYPFQSDTLIPDKQNLRDKYEQDKKAENTPPAAAPPENNAGGAGE